MPQNGEVLQLDELGAHLWVCAEVEHRLEEILLWGEVGAPQLKRIVAILRFLQMVQLGRIEIVELALKKFLVIPLMLNCNGQRIIELVVHEAEQDENILLQSVDAAPSDRSERHLTVTLN